jgi:hypothetical protein
MNRPSLSVRVAGSPLGALVLLLVWGAVVVAWYQGNVPWWVGVAAVAAAGRTFGAFGRMRRYKAWLADWQAMGAEGEQPRPKKRRGWVLVTGAALLLVLIPAYLLQIKNNEAIPNHEAVATGLIWLHVAVCLFLGWKVVALFWRFVMRRAASSKERRRAKAEAAPVAWLLGCASSSPSRAAAQRELPEYSARLIGPV